MVIGGDPHEIAQALYSKKTAGAYTHGTTAVVVKDEKIGTQTTIRYFIPTRRAVTVQVKLKPLVNYTIEIGNKIREAVSEYINALRIGQDVLVNRLYLPAQLYGGQGSETYDVIDLQLAFRSSGEFRADLSIAFNERATCAETDVVVVVT